MRERNRPLALTKNFTIRLRRMQREPLEANFIIIFIAPKRALHMFPNIDNNLWVVLSVTLFKKVYQLWLNMLLSKTLKENGKYIFKLVFNEFRSEFSWEATKLFIYIFLTFDHQPTEFLCDATNWPNKMPILSHHRNFTPNTKQQNRHRSNP